MRDNTNKRGSVLNSADLRTKKRRDGEALQAFEKIVGRSVPSPRAAKIRKPKYDRTRPNEIVLYEAPS
jgi:hypothetical protein